MDIPRKEVPMQSLPTRTLFGLPYAAAPMEEVVSWLLHRAEARMYTKVYTPNAELAARALHDTAYAALLRQGDLLLPDGVGVSLACRLAGVSAPGRLPGVEVGEALCRACGKRGVGVFFFGGRAGVAAAAAERMASRYGTPVAGVCAGYGRERDTVRERLAASGAGVVLVCLGAPAQERFIDAAPYDGVLLGLGGSMDVYAGAVRRAPAAFRRLGAEWLWRVAKQPARLPRLLSAFPLFARAAGAGIGTKFRKTAENSGQSG